MYDTTACTIAWYRSFLQGPERTYYFHSVQTNWHYTDWGPAEPKTITASSSCSPGSDLANYDSLQRKRT